MAQQIIKWAAKDGTEFSTEAEADAHDVRIVHEAIHTGFLATLDVADKTKVTIARILPLYDSYRLNSHNSSGVLPPEVAVPGMGRVEIKPRSPVVPQDVVPATAAQTVDNILAVDDLSIDDLDLDDAA